MTSRKTDPADGPSADEAANIETDARLPKEGTSLADYIADMTAELSSLADKSNFSMLSYFLNLARVEAEAHARKHLESDLATPDDEDDDPSAEAKPKKRD